MDLASSAGVCQTQENEAVTSFDLDIKIGLSRSIMATRATKMFTEGNGAPRTSGLSKIATKVTLYMIKLAKEIVLEPTSSSSSTTSTP